MKKAIIVFGGVALLGCSPSSESDYRYQGIPSGTDGYVYILDRKTGCVDLVRIGSTAQISRGEYPKDRRDAGDRREPVAGTEAAKMAAEIEKAASQIIGPIVPEPDTFSCSGGSK